MKRTTTAAIRVILIFTLFLGVFSAVWGQTEPQTESKAESDEYIAVHTREELTSLFSRVKTYLDENGQRILQNLDETANRIVAQAYIRSWAIVQYEDASPKQIDDAYDALFNMSLFLGLATDPSDAFSSGQLFEYAVQLLDQEYFDLLAASGEDEENIEYAEYLRGVAEGLVETPEEFTAEEVQDYLFEIYQETYLAAGLKAIAHTEALPLPEELFPEQEQVMMPNPMVKYDSAEPLNKMLGIVMPELPEDFGAKTGYYSIIADVLAEIEYEFPDGGRLILRLSPETESDISGVYGSEFYEDREVAGTAVQVDKYQTMLIAKGIVKTLDEKPYAFAVDAEGLPMEKFDAAVVSFIEACRNQRAEK